MSLVLFAIVIAGMHGEDSHAQMPPTEPKNPEAEKLAKAIVTAISTDNYAAFTDLLVTQREYVVLLQRSADPADREKVNDSVAEMRKVYRMARRSFDGIREEGLRDGIVWERAQYKSMKFHLDTVKGTECMRMVIIIGFRGAEYPLTATDIVKTGSGWKLLGRIRYGERDITANPYDMARAMQDSIRKADSLLVVEMMRLADSISRADSVAAMQAKRWQDSINEAERKKAEEGKSGKKKSRKQK